MAKPKTKGAPIQVRLPLDTDAAVRRQADSTGKTAAAVVEHIVDRTYRQATRSAGGQDTGVRAPIVGKVAPEHILINDPAHEHKKRSVNGAGLHVCRCTAILGIDGVWRNP